MARVAWSDLPRWQRTATVMLGSAEVVLTITAAIDLARRPAGQIHGPKAVWWPLIVIQPVGPVLYLSWGRRH